jgi:hypothetical protein
MFHELCAHIYTAVCVSTSVKVDVFITLVSRQKIWPEARFTALGAFVFLRYVPLESPQMILMTYPRFISPVVVSPSEIDVEIPQTNTVVLRLGLKIIAKIIQTLANNVLFGREAHMSILNPFLQSKVMEVFTFLNSLSVRIEFCSSHDFLISLSRDIAHLQVTKRRTHTNGKASLTMTQTPSFSTVSFPSMPIKWGRSSLAF